MCPETVSKIDVILEVNGVSCEFAIDDIFWDGGDIENLLGDVNNDGVVNVVDVVSIVSIILDNSEYNSSADYNSDGAVNVVDIVAIVDMILN